MLTSSVLGLTPNVPKSPADTENLAVSHWDCELPTMKISASQGKIFSASAVSVPWVEPVETTLPRRCILWCSRT